MTYFPFADYWWFYLGFTGFVLLLLALDLGTESGPLLVDRARERELLLNAPQPRLLRFMPALNVSLEEIDDAMSRLDQVLHDMH
jgi:acetylornithine/N-succinyldiaminopimelate aminotransferase